MVTGYGREVFSTFVPSSASAKLAGRRTALLSGALLARHGNALHGPMVEVGWRGRAPLAGVLRAVRHADAACAVGVPAELRAQSPKASAGIVDEILAAADTALYDRPLVIVARAQPLPSGASIDRLSEGLHHDLEAGFTSMAFLPAALAGDVDALVRVTAPLVEQDLGLEVELDGTADAALVLARIDDAGLSLAAVRGAELHDELGGALLVVDMERRPTAAPAAAGPGAVLRIVVDGRLERALKRVPADDTERAEAAAYLEMTEVLAELHAGGTSSRLLDALVQGMQK